MEFGQEIYLCCVTRRTVEITQSMFESILCQVTEYDPGVLQTLIELAVEIAREGREGRRIGTLFTLGDEQAVMAKSRSLILDPLSGHPESSRHVSDPSLRGTIKELAQLDGGFIVSRDGVFLSACRYLDAVAAPVDVPLGLGSRHLAAANMSAVTNAVGIVVSESSVVRLFLPRKAGRRDYPGAMDDGSCRAVARTREEGNVWRINRADPRPRAAPPQQNFSDEGAAS